MNIVAPYPTSPHTRRTLEEKREIYQEFFCQIPLNSRKKGYMFIGYRPVFTNHCS
jgi:hypothetical protein